MKWYCGGIEGISFDDVLIRPTYSELGSRQEAYPVVYLPGPNGPEHWCLAPIIAANMKTIATVEMAKALAEHHIIVPSHRFQSIEAQRGFLDKVHTPTRSVPSASSVGIGERARAEALYESDIFFLELAHADSKIAIEETKWLRNTFPDKIIIVGNVATADACKRLFEAGACFVKAGIGSGYVCSTRTITGCGVPQLSAIDECSHEGSIIADGGIRNSGDVVKALAIGASFVMIGSLLAGTDEALGERLYENGITKKAYFGMASREAGRVGENNVPEGISTTVPYVGPAGDVVKNLISGIRQGMSMVGAATLSELREKAIFQRITSLVINENNPLGRK